jgi:hypothetical protein
MTRQASLLRRLIFVFLAVTFLSSCAKLRLGEDFDIEKFKSQVKRGETTKAEIVKMLGPASATGMVVEADGTEYTRWLYYHMTGRLIRLRERSIKMLEVHFDKNNIVAKYDWTLEVRTRGDDKK